MRMILIQIKYFLHKINTHILTAVNTIIKSIYPDLSYEKTIKDEILYITINNKSENFQSENFNSNIKKVIFVFNNNNKNDINKLLNININKSTSGNYILYLIIFFVILMILIFVIFFYKQSK